LGHSVLVDNVIATELAGVLLLTAIIGGITLARLKPSDSEGES
jgi:NADH:ubiquinone oxidoreductase subunit 6 (subunit J)